MEARTAAPAGKGSQAGVRGEVGKEALEAPLGTRHCSVTSEASGPLGPWFSKGQPGREAALVGSGFCPCST